LKIHLCVRESQIEMINEWKIKDRLFCEKTFFTINVRANEIRG